MKEFRPVNLLDVRDQCIFVEFWKLGQWIESLECDQLWTKNNISAAWNILKRVSVYIISESRCSKDEQNMLSRAFWKLTRRNSFLPKIKFMTDFNLLWLLLSKSFLLLFCRLKQMICEFDWQTRQQRISWETAKLYSYIIVIDCNSAEFSCPAWFVINTAFNKAINCWLVRLD